MRIVHGLLSTYSHIELLQTSGLAEALRKSACSVELVSGFYLPEESAREVDLTVFTFDLLSMRGNRHWPSIVESMREWSEKSALTVGMVQDDFTRPAATEKIGTSGIVDFLLSPHGFDPNRIRLLYPNLSPGKVLFARNGYLDEEVLKAFESRLERYEVRRKGPVLGRASKLDGKFGALGDHKSQALSELSAVLKSRKIPHDFETDGKARLRGFGWYQRIHNSRAVVNPVGGASLIDRHGFRRWMSESTVLNPLTMSNWVKKQTVKTDFPMPNYGPRVLESLALGTPQVLTYFPGVVESLFPNLTPWKHFIPLDVELYNLDEVADALNDFRLLEKISIEGREYISDHPQFFFQNLAEQILSLPEENGKSSERPAEIEATTEDSNLENHVLSLSEKLVVHEALMRVLQTTPICASLKDFSEAVRREKQILLHLSDRAADLFERLAYGVQNGKITPLGAHYFPLMYEGRDLEKHNIDKIMES